MIKLRTTLGVALLAVSMIGGAGCEKKKDADKGKTEAPATTTDAAAGSGSGSATGSAAGTVPAAGSGSAAVAPTGTESTVIAELHALRDASCLCKDQACVDGIQQRFDGFIQKNMNAKPGPGEEQLAEKYATEMMECMMKAGGASAGLGVPSIPGADPDPSIAAPRGDGAAAGTGTGTGLPMCDEYLAVVEKFMSCDQVPKDTRDQTRAGVDQMKDIWAQAAALPPDARASISDACKQGRDAMVSGAKSLGCAL